MGVRELSVWANYVKKQSWPDPTDLAGSALPKLLSNWLAKANGVSYQTALAWRNEGNSNAKQDRLSADTRALMLLNVSVVTGKTSVLQTFQNALFLYELFAASADVIE